MAMFKWKEVFLELFNGKGNMFFELLCKLLLIIIMRLSKYAKLVSLNAVAPGLFTENLNPANNLSADMINKMLKCNKKGNLAQCLAIK